jgi:HPt (histidine-containing phosphotransfer) domain-containing protein
MEGVDEEPQAADAAPGRLDPDALEGLRELAEQDPDRIRHAVRLFVEDARARVEQLLAAHRRGDAAQVRGLAHSLKGGSAIFGAASMAALCAEIERAAIQDLGLDGAVVARLQSELESAAAALGDAFGFETGDGGQGTSAGPGASNR